MYTAQNRKEKGYRSLRQGRVEDIQHKDSEKWSIYSTQTRKSGRCTAQRQGRVEDIQYRYGISLYFLAKKISQLSNQKLKTLNGKFKVGEMLNQAGFRSES